jgi:lactate dehydrogenase-like 2-hydroxyacid dehydrogenase
MPNEVLITKREIHKAATIFGEAADLRFLTVPGDETALAAAVREHNIRATVVGAAPYRGPLYEALAAVHGQQPALVARFGVGCDGVDLPQAARLGILVTNTPGTLDASVAEHAFWLLGAVTRRLAQLDAAFRRGMFVPYTGLELFGKTLAVVGFGGIGRRVAAIALRGFGMRVIAVGKRGQNYFSPINSSDPFFGENSSDPFFSYTDDVDGALAEADVASIHLPARPETRHYFDAARLARMKPGALLINTARGAVLDENALFDALTAGHLAGAGLDVFAAEPYQPVSPERDLRTLPQVVLTPHVASNTREANARMAVSCVTTLRNFFAGRFDALPLVS